MRGWSALLGALGVVALVFALLSVILMLFGAPPDPGWLWGNAVLGVLLLGSALFNSLDALRERMHSGEAQRVGKYGTSAIVTTLLSLVILGMLAFLATRNSVRFDWTESGTHSLSDQSRKVLAGLERDVEVTGFYSALEWPPVRNLLERYSYESKRFHVEHADPTARPDLVQKYGIGSEQLSRGVLRVSLGDESTVLDDVTEEKLTNALVKLTRGAEKTVYFLTGHRERPATAEGSDGEGGFGRAAEALRNENYIVKSVVLGQVGEVPKDADVVVVPGPTDSLRPEELASLESYMKRGGALLVMIDPGVDTNLTELLLSWGIDFGDDVVIDEVQGLFGRPATPLAAEYAAHPITEGLREVTIFHVVRSVTPREEAGDAFDKLVLTGENSWAESNLEGAPERDADDVPGPVSIAVAGTLRFDTEAGEGAEARIVAFGDSDFAANEMLDAYRNRDLFLNSVNWLLGDVEAISIRPNQTRASRVQMTSEQFTRIRYLALFVLPEALAVLGAIAWWSRRRAPGR